MGLSFLNAMLLGGAALVAVPVVLHLLMRRKPVPHPFPALRFLQARAIRNRRRLRLNHLLLLLVRMAAIVALALAFARPVLRGAAGLTDGEGPVAAVIVVDTAPRMLLREGNRTRLDRVRELSETLFEKLPQGSQVAVVDTGGGPVVFSPSVAAASERITRLAAAAPESSLAAVMEAAARQLQMSPLERRELYVFTDRSRGGWADASAAGFSGAFPGIKPMFIDVAAQTADNCGIETLELASDQLAGGSPLSLAVATRRSGPPLERAIAVELQASDGRFVRRAEKPVSWSEDAAGEASFEIGGLEPGVVQGRVIIDGADALDADNELYFTVAVANPVRVLVAAGKPAEQTGLFFGQAVAPLALARAGRARFDLTVVDYERFEAAAWDDLRGIVLLDPPPLTERTWRLLEEYVAAGHGLMLWLGPASGTAAAFNSVASTRVLGAEVVRIWRSPAGDNYLAPMALDHPALAAFRRVGDSVPWEDYPVLRHWEMRPVVVQDGEVETSAVPVVTYRNGLPAVLEHRVGQGTVLVVTTPVSQAAADPESWNSLATGFEPWPFVMLANELLLHAVDDTDDRNLISGQPARLRVVRQDLPNVLVQTPTGETFPAAVDPKRGMVAVTATRMPGNYRIRAGGEVGGLAEGFSVNLDPAATDFTPLDAAATEAALGAAADLVRDEQQLVREVVQERVGSELYGWLIVLGAVVMAGDWLLANRFYASRDDADEAPKPAAAFVAQTLQETPNPGRLPPPVPAVAAVKRSQPRSGSLVPPPLPQDFPVRSRGVGEPTAPEPSA